ncbi:MAG: hypothetical protein HFP81_02660 [Methylococcales symbiont of Hymedesmia sp. n. MRB-2018]|nr:MAG: hypothetical protein HFP81_02660 [Methylococcales symbiont of Hymedesmia sp. n. MRB-2018]
MKYYNLPTLLIFVAFALPLKLVAQTQNEEFDVLHEELKFNFDNKKYSQTLTTLRVLKKIIVKEQNVKDASFIKSQTKEFDVLFSKAKTPAKLYVGNKTVKIHYGGKNLYVIRNNPNSYFKSDYLFYSELPVEFEGKLAIQNKYLKIDGQTKRVKFTSNDKNILTIDDGGKIKVKKLGNVVITISVDDNFTKIPIKIIDIPLTRGMTRDEVIATLGLADKVNKKYIGWVESKHVDGIFYYANNVNGISVEHWIYKEYPYAILRFGYSGLNSCTIASWESLSTKKYSLEHK